jgi:hypothetical protein
MMSTRRLSWRGEGGEASFSLCCVPGGDFGVERGGLSNVRCGFARNFRVWLGSGAELYMFTRRIFSRHFEINRNLKGSGCSIWLSADFPLGSDAVAIAENASDDAFR